MGQESIANIKVLLTLIIKDEHQQLMAPVPMMVVCVSYKPEYDFHQTLELGSIELGCCLRCQTMVGMMDIRGCNLITVPAGQEYCSLGLGVGQRTCGKI